MNKAHGWPRLWFYNINMSEISGFYNYSYTYRKDSKLLIASSGMEISQVGIGSFYQGMGVPEEDGTSLMISLSGVGDNRFRGTWDDLDVYSRPTMGGRLLLARTAIGFAGYWLGEPEDYGVMSLTQQDHNS
jgi:hypothetical protein